MNISLEQCELLCSKSIDQFWSTINQPRSWHYFMNYITKVLSKQKNWIVAFSCFNLAWNDSSVFERLKAKSFNVLLMHQHLCLSIHLTTVVGVFSRPLKVASPVPVSKCRVYFNFNFCQKQKKCVTPLLESNLVWNFD